MRRFVRYLLSIIATAFMLIMVACQQELVFDGPCEVRFVAEVQNEVNVTRATDGYTALPYSADFNAGLYVSYGATAQPYTMSWVNNSKLSANLWLETGDYKFYGYAPQQDGASFDNTNKTLTIRNIPGLSDKDMLVINPCSATVTSAELGGTKTVSLQMDHLMAKITPYFYINSTYNNLREIEIKSVKFTLEDSKTFQANVTYNDNNLSYTTTWEASVSTSVQEIPLFKDNSNTINFLTTSSTGAQSYGQCYIVPSQNGQDITNLKMTVTYDVYDKKQQRVRENETATNKVVVKVNSTTKTKLEAGKNYKLNIQIIPTYLYVLSDNDESSVLVISNN